MIKDVLSDADNRMKMSLKSLEEDLSGIRTGRANPALVDKISVDYYGAPTPLQQLATLSNINSIRQIAVCSKTKPIPQKGGSL